MKIALISVLSSDDASQNGVWGKICAIQDGLKELNHDCDVFHLSNDGIQKNNITLIATTRHLSYRRLFISNSYIPLIKGFLIDYDLIWIRHAFFGPSLISILKKLKDNNPALKIVYELPTYPYIHEFKGLKKVLIKVHEKFILTKLSPALDRIITYSADDQLFGVETIKLNNGVNVNSYPIMNGDSGQVTFLAIGNLWNWYGLDRIIRGLGKYKRKHIEADGPKLLIIGEGEELDKLTSLVNEYNVSEFVRFIGWKSKTEIDVLSVSNPVGIGTLAIHRKKVELSSSLKHREFTARGIPFVLAGEDPDFQRGCPFVLHLPANDSPINIDTLISWHENLNVNPEGIRDYAVEHLDWTIKIKALMTSLEKV